MNIDRLVYIPIHIAPGVYIRVIDEIYPDVSHPDKYNALFFIASNYGPANQLVPITTEEQFLKTFGVAPINYPWSSLMAQNHAKYATAYCIRLLPYNATYANITAAITPLYILDLRQNPNLISTTNLNQDTIDAINDSNIDQYTIAKDTQNRDIFVIRLGYINSQNKFVYNINNVQVTANLINDFITLPQNTLYAIELFKFSGLGEFYNKMAVGFNTNVDNTFDLVIYTKIDDTTYSTLGTFPNRAIFTQLDEYGTDIKLENNKSYAGLQYTLNEINLTNIKTTAGNNRVLYVRRFRDLQYFVELINLKDIETVKGAEFVRSIINVTDKNNLQGGSDGSLKNPDGTFNYSVFASMVKDVLYGNSRLTGSSTSYLAEPIYDLLDEELFIKYIYDPTDHRFSQTDRNSVHVALYDFARNRYFSNAGAVVIANLAPINDPFDKNELDSKQIVRSELFTAYISTFDGVVNGISYDKWPHIQLIARDLIAYRAGKALDDSFAGAIAAQHAGIRKINRKYTLAERNILTLRGLNYLVKDQRYGTYTDLGRTTYPFNSALRWLYVIEDIIDIKYELKVALKPFLHKLETYDWSTLIRRIDNMIFKPRRSKGLLTEYNIQLVQDETYILQNILPIVVSLRYARSMERISVTLYVR